MDSKDKDIERWRYNSRHSPFALFYRLFDKVSVLDISSLSNQNKKEIFEDLSYNDFAFSLKDIYLCLLSEALHIDYRPIYHSTAEKIKRLKSDGDFELLCSNSASTGLKLNRMITRVEGFLEFSQFFDEKAWEEANRVFKDNNNALKGVSNPYAAEKIPMTGGIIEKIHAHSNVLRELSCNVRRWISQQPFVKEESITDRLLFDASENIDCLYYVAFSRHEEGRKTGADWEWWFVFDNFSLRIRVQAKKLFTKNDNYSSIAYTNRYGLQIEKLIRDSFEENYLPLYAFYTPQADLTMCGKSILDEGVYLAGAKTIYHEYIVGGKREITADLILKLSNPLSCLFGCPLSSKNRERLLIDFFIRYYPLDSKKENQESKNDLTGNDILGYHKELPSYVTSFIENIKKGMPDWWESQYRKAIENTNALLVYDARNQQNMA